MFDFKRKYKYILCIIPLIMLYRYDLVFFPERTTESVGQVFLMHMFGGSYNKLKIDLQVSVIGLIGVFYLTLLFADYLYNDLVEYPEYIFTRYKGRNHWFYKKTWGLFQYCNLGIFLYFIPYVVNAIRESEKRINEKDIFLILCTYIMLFLFSYYMILIVNLFSIYWGTAIGFVVAYSIVISSGLVTFLLQNIRSMPIVGIVHKLNPMSNLLISWNFADSQILWGLGYYIFLNIITLFVIRHKVNHYEIGIRKK